jgi:hypothetical protein
MQVFDPLNDVIHSERILDGGQWPNFHDAEVHDLNIWRGDVRPEGDVWTGPVLEVSFELYALREPFIAVLKFHDCEGISLADFNHQNAVHDLSFEYFDRGRLNDGSPMAPGIAVTFEQAFGATLSFNCARVEALGRRAAGSTGLRDMLRALEPRLVPGEYVFCSVLPAVAEDIEAFAALASFREDEGLTLVLERGSADAEGLRYDHVFRCLTLGVHSELDAVGLTAAVSARLAQSGISANVIAAYHHDHVFVPAARAREALAALEGLSGEA